MGKLKKEAQQLLEHQQKDTHWFGTFSLMVGFTKPQLKVSSREKTRSPKTYHSVSPKNQTELEEVRRVSSIQKWGHS